MADYASDAHYLYTPQFQSNSSSRAPTPSNTTFSPSIFSARYRNSRPSTAPSRVPGQSSSSGYGHGRFKVSSGSSTRPRRDSDGRTSMMSNQTSRTRRTRPPSPPSMNYASFTPAMNEDEDARSERRAMQGRLKGFVKSIKSVFKPNKSSKNKRESFLPAPAAGQVALRTSMSTYRSSPPMSTASSTSQRR